jgi:hypothetical protein
MAARAAAYDAEHMKAQKVALRATALLVRAFPALEKAAMGVGSLTPAEQCRVTPSQPISHSTMLCAIEDATRAAYIKASLVHQRAEGSYNPSAEAGTLTEANSLQRASARHLAGLAAFTSPHKADKTSPKQVRSPAAHGVSSPVSAAKQRKRKKRR